VLAPTTAGQSAFDGGEGGRGIADQFGMEEREVKRKCREGQFLRLQHFFSASSNLTWAPNKGAATRKNTKGRIKEESRGKNVP